MRLARIRTGCRTSVPNDEQPNTLQLEMTRIVPPINNDKQITGKYCIRQGSEFVSEQSCGPVEGYFNSQQCKGPAAAGGGS